jgi:ATP-dependent RNA helicase DeaD
MLRKGVHVVIGTPGRVMDHLRRETLVLDSLKTLILDEADEMLRMGFAEDVEWILQHVPEQRQIGLFSATMPAAIKEIAETHLRDPIRISIKTKTSTASTIKPYFLPVNNAQKIDALANILEIEESDAVIVFVKTKRATEEVAEELTTRGFNAVAINGDIVQKQRERIIDHLKTGKIKILIATDVAARGIDVDRITHVINYDAPNNPESYIHRIGRTGRAGRAGTAIIFISNRDRFILRNIEQTTKQPIEQLTPPSIKAINERRVAAFKQRITDAASKNISFFETLIKEYIEETSMPAEKVAAALAKLVQGETPLILKKEVATFNMESSGRGRDRREPREFNRERSNGGRGRGGERREFDGERRGRSGERREFGGERSGERREFGGGRETREFDGERGGRGRSGERREFGGERSGRETREFSGERNSRGSDTRARGDKKEFPRAREFSNDRAGTGRGERGAAPRDRRTTEYGMEQYRVEIGHIDGIQPKNLVGAIASTAGIEGRLIGKIKIEDRFSIIDLPKGMPKDALQSLQRLKLVGKQMKMHKI